jgi:hypothetical protein
MICSLDQGNQQNCQSSRYFVGVTKFGICQTFFLIKFNLSVTTIERKNVMSHVILLEYKLLESKGQKGNNKLLFIQYILYCGKYEVS